MKYFPQALALFTVISFTALSLGRVATSPAGYPWFGELVLFAPSAVMPVLVTLAVLGSAIFVILSQKYPAETEKWAYGSVGVLVGFWLPA